MVSIVITAANEAATIGRAIEALLAEPLPEGSEILVVCPDQGTAGAAAQYASRSSNVRVLRDAGRGKPAALNVALQVVAGELVVLTDGDVHVAPGAIGALLQPLTDDKVGAVTGRPMSSSPRSTMLGYWSHFLVDAAHEQRMRRAHEGQYLECSGYLYALRRSLLTAPIPEDALAEDGLISYRIWQQGYRIAYAPTAVVYVKYPSTYADWMKQKTRSAGGYAQPYMAGAHGMRSLRSEAVGGAWSAVRYATTARERWWTALLFLARLHLWLRVAWQVRLRKRSLAEMWKRVESTK